MMAFPSGGPLLGYYAEGDPSVMDWQIKWAVEHGIGFFAFDGKAISGVFLKKLQ